MFTSPVLVQNPDRAKIAICIAPATQSCPSDEGAITSSDAHNEMLRSSVGQKMITNNKTLSLFPPFGLGKEKGEPTPDNTWKIQKYYWFKRILILVQF